MRVRLVQKEDRPRVRIEIGKEKEGLLESPPRGGDIERYPPLPVAHRDLAAFRDVARRREVRTEETVDLFDQRLPLLRLLLMNPVHQVAQYLCRAGLPDAHVDRTIIEAGLGCRQTRHRRQEGDGGSAGFIRNRHPHRGSSFGHP